MPSVRLEGIGPRGEACIIVRTVDLAEADLAGVGTAFSHRLATGERLVPADVDGAFRTLDGARTFRLRDLVQAGADPPPQARQGAGRSSSVIQENVLHGPALPRLP